MDDFTGTMFDHGLKTKVEGVEKTITHNDTIAILNQTISGTYTQAEVQAISTKLDSVIVMLKGAGIIK